MKPYCFAFVGMVAVVACGEEEPEAPEQPAVPDAGDASLAVPDGSVAKPDAGKDTPQGESCYEQGCRCYVATHNDYQLRDDGALWHVPGYGPFVRVLGPGNELLSFSSMDVTWKNMCAVTTDGRLLCAGDSSSGERGNGSVTKIGEEVPDDFVYKAPGVLLTDVASVSVGGTHICAVDKAGSLWCWGGAPAFEDDLLWATPVLAADGGPFSDVVQVSVSDDGRDIACRKRDGTIWQWTNGAINNRDITTKPTLVPLAEPATDVSRGADVTCAILASKTVHCWGSGALGRGSDDMTYRPPAAVLTRPGVALENVRQINSTSGSSCAVLEDASIWCWGNVDTEPALFARPPTDIRGKVFTGAKYLSSSTGIQFVTVDGKIGTRLGISEEPWNTPCEHKTPGAPVCLEAGKRSTCARSL